MHECLIGSVSLLTGDLFSGLVSLQEFVCLCVCVCMREYLFVSVFVCFFANWRPAFGSCKFARICVCVCVCARVCMHECFIVSVSLLTGDLFSGLVSLQ